MPVPIKVPKLGESVTEAIVGRWIKTAGSFVRRDEPVCELLSDKASVEVPAPADGKLVIQAAEGATVPVESVIGTVDETAQAPAAAAPVGPAPEKAVTAPAHPAANALPTAPAAEVLLSPSARQLAADRGIDPGQLTGTGRGGRVIKEDVLALADQRPPVPVAPAKTAPAAPVAVPAAVSEPRAAGPRETRSRMSPLRQTIANRLLSAQQNAAILTTFNEADLSAVMALRAKYKEVFQKRHNVGLGFMSFFVKASVEALRAFPAVNSRIEGNEIVQPHYYNISVAVSTDKGLTVPVLRDVDKLSFAAIEKGIAALAAKARDGKTTVADFQDGTFTITNGGIFGSLLSTPILNPPQSGILGMHSIQKRPVVVDDQVVIRPMMYLALSYDHRIVDGREAVSFLVRVKECIENPERLMLEI